MGSQLGDGRRKLLSGPKNGTSVASSSGPGVASRQPDGVGGRRGDKPWSTTLVHHRLREGGKKSLRSDRGVAVVMRRTTQNRRGERPTSEQTRREKGLWANKARRRRMNPWGLQGGKGKHTTKAR